jgi:hypothetical protein
MVPTTPLEHIGFQSLLKASPATLYDCAINYHTIDFPQQLLHGHGHGTSDKIDGQDGKDGKDGKDGQGLAACLATPSDPPAEPRAPVFRPPMVAKWICAGDEKLAQRFNHLRRRLRTFRNKKKGKKRKRV